VLRARLDPEVGAAVLKALEAAAEVLYEQKKSQDEQGDGVPVAQRRADALGLVAEAALAGGLDPGTRGDRLQVVVHVDEEVLKDPSKPGMSMLEDGGDVSAETSRRLACDAGKVVMTHDAEGKILDVGRRTRTIPTRIRRALTHRDQSCRFPGCGRKYCEAHHLEHWANGGETSLENLALLCRYHHRAVHEEGYRIERSSDGDLHFFHPSGWEIPFVPPAVALTRDPLEALSTRLVEEGVSIDAKTGFPTWEGGPLDLSAAIDGLRQRGRARDRCGPSSASIPEHDRPHISH
jgi:hypothetical protein